MSEIASKRQNLGESAEHFKQQNQKNKNIRGLLKRKADLNIARIQDVGLSGKDDATILEWAAQENRILIILLADYSYENQWEGKILYLPLKDR